MASTIIDMTELEMPSVMVADGKPVGDVRVSSDVFAATLFDSSSACIHDVARRKNFYKPSASNPVLTHDGVLFDTNYACMEFGNTVPDKGTILISWRFLTLASYNYIFTKYRYGTFAFYFDGVSGGRVSIFTSGFLTYSFTQSPLVVGNTYRFVIAYERNTTGGIRVYINGILEATLNSEDVSTGTDTLYIGGRDPSTTDRHCGGVLQDFRIINRCLSDGEVKDLYKDWYGIYELAQ